MARKPKLDAVLAAAVDDALAAVVEIAGDAAVGPHSGTVADADRLVTHRFKAHVEGYAGWEWYATLARVPRGKAASVCEVGLLPGEGALLAPAWVPWAERVKPEELAAAAEAEAGAAAGEVAAAGDSGPVASPGTAPGTDTQDAAEPSDSPEGGGQTGHHEEPGTGGEPGEHGHPSADGDAGADGDPEAGDGRAETEPGTRSFRRRTVRRRRNPRARRGSGGAAH